MRKLLSLVCGALALGGVALESTSASAFPVETFAPITAAQPDAAVESARFCHFGNCRGRPFMRRRMVYRPVFHRRRGICHNGRCRG